MQASDIIAHVRLLLEIPEGSNWPDENIETIIGLAYRSLYNDFNSIDWFPSMRSETVTLTSVKQYTLTNEYPRILNIYKEDFTYEVVDPQVWPTDRRMICWWDRVRKQLNFFREPEVQGDFTVLCPAAFDTTDFSDFPYEYEQLLVLKTCILTAKADKERVDIWQDELDKELYKIEQSVSKQTAPRYVRMAPDGNQRSF